MVVVTYLWLLWPPMALVLCRVFPNASWLWLWRGMMKMCKGSGVKVFLKLWVIALALMIGTKFPVGLSPQHLMLLEVVLRRP